MSDSINIRRDVEDKYYRYKMPRLIAKVEGRGNGIKTVIPNMSAISTALTRPPAYSAKFFGFELGALTFIDAKTDRYGVNGAHEAEKLASLLDTYIQKFVLCADCKNPETDLIIKNKSDIYRDCKACGSKTLVDHRHKLATYILKNPPSAGHADKYKKKLKKRHGSGSATPSGEKAHGDDEDDALTRSIQEGAKNMAGLSIDDEDDWAEDMSPAAIAARQSELASDAVKKMTGSVEDPYEDFAAYIEENPDALPKEIKDEADRLSISDDKACAIMMQVLFNASIDKGEIEAKSPILELFVSSGEKAQKGLLGGLERLCGEMFPKVLLDKVPVLLMALYEADLVEEDVFIAWSEKWSKRYVDKSTGKKIRSKAAPFITWLKEADSDEE